MADRPALPSPAFDAAANRDNQVVVEQGLQDEILAQGRVVQRPAATRQHLNNDDTPCGYHGWEAMAALRES
jgi:hypothetical protein